MNSQPMIVTLFSSNSTEQYTKDIFTVLSMPRGSIYQFRYQKDYIVPHVREMFNKKTDLSIKALVTFRSKVGSPDNECFCVPIRWVTIKLVNEISNGYSIIFEINGYPSFTSDFRNNSARFEDINKYAKTFFSRMPNKNISVLDESLEIVNLDDTFERDSENWFEIVRRLTLLPDYKDYYFLKCSSPYVEKGNNLKRGNIIENCHIEDNYVQFIERACVYIDVEYYAASYDLNRKRQIDVFVDENVLSKVKGLRTTLQSRYGAIKLGLQSKEVSNNTVTEVVINTNSSIRDEVQTEIVFPIIVKINMINKIKKSILTSVGALFVAMPGLLSDVINVGWKLLIAFIGVLIMGVNNYLEFKD